MRTGSCDGGCASFRGFGALHFPGASGGLLSRLISSRLANPGCRRQQKCSLRSRLGETCGIDMALDSGKATAQNKCAVDRQLQVPIVSAPSALSLASSHSFLSLSYMPRLPRRVVIVAAAKLHSTQQTVPGCSAAVALTPPCAPTGAPTEPRCNRAPARALRETRWYGTGQLLEHEPCFRDQRLTRCQSTSRPPRADDPNPFSVFLGHRPWQPPR